jgi:Fe-S-cluster containining protein
MSDAFPCNGCGACCKSIQLSELTSWLDRGDGVCKFFDAMHNICTIYENRPDSKYSTIPVTRTMRLVTEKK